MKVFKDILLNRKIQLIIFLIICIGISVGIYLNKKDSLNKKVIRFHVLANSDSNLDQGVKLKVKDNVIKYIHPLLKESSSLDESRKILNENKDEIINIANKTLKENGQDYVATAEMAKQQFPVKSYGNIVFPSGEYEAFRILLGKAEGKNWWCVMFPPLCFVDVKNALADVEMEEELKKTLSDSEIEAISQTNKEEKTKFKFKSVEVVKDLIKK